MLFAWNKQTAFLYKYNLNNKRVVNFLISRRICRGFLLFKIVSFRNHRLDFHKPRRCTSFVFVEFHNDILYGFLELRNHNVFEGVDSSSVLFDLVGKHIASFFDLCKFEKFGEQFRKRGYGTVKFARNACKRVWIQILAFPFRDAENGHVDAHNVL